jgi:thioredoxin-related protein
MKKLLTIILLALSMTVSAQDTTTIVKRICYNSVVKIDNDKDNDDGKSRLKDACFIFGDETITLVNSRGKEFVYEVKDLKEHMMGETLAYMIEVERKGKEYVFLIEENLRFIALHFEDKNKTDWYFTSLE